MSLLLEPVLESRLLWANSNVYHNSNTHHHQCLFFKFLVFMLHFRLISKHLLNNFGITNSEFYKLVARKDIIRILKHYQNLTENRMLFCCAVC